MCNGKGRVHVNIDVNFEWWSLAIHRDGSNVHYYLSVNIGRECMNEYLLMNEMHKNGAVIGLTCG